MPRYIEADALHSMVARALDANESATDVTDAIEQEHRVLYWILEKIEEQTIVSPDEVRGAGKWVRISGYQLDHEYYPSRYKCDQCGHFVDSGDDRNFCPNCGAKMEVTSE